jgi:hypothetical protein
MANDKRIKLESVLRARQLDHTLTTALPVRMNQEPGAVMPSGVVALDTALAGGLPRGQLSVIAGPRSSGRTTLLLQVLGTTTRQGEWAALVDAFDCVDQGSLERAGIVRDRLLWIRGQAVIEASVVPGRGVDAAVKRALKAWHLVLQAGGFGVAVLDFADLSPAVLNRVPFTTWLRVQRVLEDSDTVGVILALKPVARSAGGLSLLLTGTPCWTSTAGLSRCLKGLDVRIQTRSPRRWPETEVRMMAATRRW